MDKRVKFDFEIDFTNGGGLQGCDFRLDIPGGDISDDALADAIVRDMRLLMVGDVRIRNKEIIEEEHKRRVPDETPPGKARVRGFEPHDPRWACHLQGVPAAGDSRLFEPRRVAKILCAGDGVSGLQDRNGGQYGERISIVRTIAMRTGKICLRCVWKTWSTWKASSCARRIARLGQSAWSSSQGERFGTGAVLVHTGWDRHLGEGRLFSRASVSDRGSGDKPSGPGVLGWWGSTR